MSTNGFTPALGTALPARFFDHVVALTRERLWRALVVSYLAPRPGEVIVDVGCGTGTLALSIGRVASDAVVIGVDPDPEILDVARRKPAAERVDWRVAMGQDVADAVGANAVDGIVSSLVLHQCSMHAKRATLAAMYRALRSGGRLVIADYGLHRTWLMRTAFRIVQLADGAEDTQPNADGVLPALIAEAGFDAVREVDVVSTVSGSISVYVARKP